MPVLPPGLVRTGLSRTWGRQVPLPLALAAEILLWVDGGTGVTSAARRIQTAQEAVTEREAAERMLLTGYFRIAVPGDPYALSAVPEGLPGQQTVWIFAPSLLAAMYQVFSAHSNACEKMADRRSDDQVATWVDSYVNTPEDQALPALKQTAAPGRVLDSMRENSDHPNAPHRPSVTPSSRNG